MTRSSPGSAVAFINRRLEDLAEANAIYGKDQRLSAQDKIARNDREISWLKDLRSMLALSAVAAAPSKEALDWASGEVSAIEAYKAANPDWLEHTKPAREVIGPAQATRDVPFMAQEILDFLNSIEGAGYGGMASFEIVRGYAKDLALSSTNRGGGA